ncbi:MAG TPA: hypothetical protein DIW17_04070 [Clostridiales bacterium]|nr:hypothetical protein [Clostridiales bacterium]
MKNRDIGRNKRKRKIIQLHEKEPLLKSLDIEQLISMISPDEVEKAQATLKEFLEGFKHLDVNRKIILAYIIGEMQGFENMYSERAGKSLAEKIEGVYKTGFNWGYVLASQHFPQKESHDEL